MGICMDGSALRSLTDEVGLRGGRGSLCRMRVICHVGKLTDATITGNSSSYVSLQDSSDDERRSSIFAFK